MVTLPLNNNITHLQHAVFEGNDNKLMGLKKTDLYVYPKGTDINSIDPSTPTLKLSRLVSSLDTTGEQPVIVVARAPVLAATQHTSQD